VVEEEVGKVEELGDELLDVVDVTAHSEQLQHSLLNRVFTSFCTIRNKMFVSVVSR
jgi:hypothetical protein